ncbi:MAG: anti-sigma F factor antagonist [Dethiobacter sp.]|nr:anti-sigma F factor antagonist [Dethiobacter sp.]
MQAKLRMAGKTLVVRMQGELDHHTVDILREQIDEKVTGGQANNVLFNFQSVNFMDSSGLGMVLGRYRAVMEKGGRVLACSLQPPVQRVFELSGLQNRIPVFHTEQEALRNV